MSDKVKCLHCGKEVIPESFGGKNFCSECGNEIIEVAAPAPVESAPADVPSEGASVIQDGMGIIENTRTKVGAVDTFSDNSVTNHTTHNTTNITHVSDDTKKSVVCEISGKKVLITSSVQCPVCGKTVSIQYYDEEKLRCTECEKRAVKEYEKYFVEFTKDARVIDKDLREILDAKAKSLKVTELQVKELELKLRKANSGKEAHLTEIKKKDFERTIVQLYQEKITPESAYSKVSAYAKITSDPAVQCWYHVLWAVCNPKEYVESLKNATVDEYWQNLWAFAAYAKLNDIASAIDAVDIAKEKYPENVNDIILAQAYLGVCQYFSSEDEAYLQDSGSYFQSVSSPESDCLFFHYERFEELYNVMASDDYDILNVTTLLLTRKVTKGYPFSGPTRPALSPDHRDVNKSESVVAQAVASRQEQKVPAAQQTPRPAQNTAPAKQNVQQPSPAKQNPLATKPVSQPQTVGQKGVVLNNTAGGPANPQVSFTGASPAKSKKKGGSSVIVVILILALLGAGAFFFLKNKPQPKAKEVKVEKSVASAEVKSTPTATPATPTTPSAPTTPETPSQPKKPATMAQKAAAQKAEAQKAVAAATTNASAVVAAGPGAADLAKAMEAYKAGDFKTAHDYFKSAGNAGNAEACYQLGLMLSTGKGSVAKNTLQSKVWLKKAAGLGHEAAKAAIQ